MPTACQLLPVMADHGDSNPGQSRPVADSYPSWAPHELWEAAGSLSRDAMQWLAGLYDAVDLSAAWDCDGDGGGSAGTACASLVQKLLLRGGLAELARHGILSPELCPSPEGIFQQLEKSESAAGGSSLLFGTVGSRVVRKFEGAAALCEATLHVCGHDVPCIFERPEPWLRGAMVRLARSGTVILLRQSAFISSIPTKAEAGAANQQRAPCAGVVPVVDGAGGSVRRGGQPGWCAK